MDAAAGLTPSQAGGPPMGTFGLTGPPVSTGGRICWTGSVMRAAGLIIGKTLRDIALLVANQIAILSGEIDIFLNPRLHEPLFSLNLCHAGSSYFHRLNPRNAWLFDRTSV